MPPAAAMVASRLAVDTYWQNLSGAPGITERIAGTKRPDSQEPLGSEIMI